MPHITDHGQQIHYRVVQPSRRTVGSSTTIPRALVFVPGDTSSSACLTGELRYFGHRYRSLAVDPPGTGRSQRLRVWQADRWHLTAAAVAALTEGLDLAPAVIVGSSDGGLTALLTAVEYPGLVCGVVVDSCPPVLDAADLAVAASARRQVLAAGRGQGSATAPEGHPLSRPRSRMRRLERSWFWRRAHGSDWKTVVAADADLLERLGRAGGLDLLAERLPAVQCPVLFTGSLEDDRFHDLGPRLEAAAEHMQRAQAFLWPEGGHPLMRTAPAAFRRAVDEFLVDISGAAGDLDTTVEGPHGPDCR